MEQGSHQADVLEGLVEGRMLLQQRFPEGTEVVFTLAQAVQVSLPAEQLTVPGVMRAIRGVMESLAHPGSSVLLADGRPLQLDPSALTYDTRHSGA
ncbi:hypothetical protein HaLaN_14039 [Haematococcus lacustris]|uniref:Uncharacterized protein n=1 Tax=Haematococcus lacustris TaxID=44745 RepID=A0A699ZEU3_HAELA|nr:hypothetical protein HaLaN_14039 [Haematococcus lacustris]